MRDVVVSYYSYLRWKRDLSDNVSFQDFVNKFTYNKLASVPFGSWAKHTRSWLDAIQRSLVDGIIIRYEDLQVEPEKALARVFRFCGCSVSKEAIESAVRNNTVDRMREKEKIAYKNIFFDHRKDLQFIQEARSKRWVNTIPLDILEIVVNDCKNLLVELRYGMKHEFS